MADLSITASAVGLVRADDNGLVPAAPAAVAITAGAAVYIDSTGKFALADGSAAGTAGVAGIALGNAAIGQAVSAVRSGLVDLGNALGGLAFGASVYLSDTDAGILGDGAGTVSVVVGKVVPAFGNGATADKLLRVSLPASS